MAQPALGLRYVIERRLGEGAFGAVDAAVDSASGQPVALKSLKRAQASALVRFKQEFRALSDLHHPNLVGLRELFEHDSVWFIAMELVEGCDLLAWVRPVAASANENGGELDLERLRTTFADMAEGLRALHGHGLLHRDLKPSNVRVTEGGRAVLLDFGLVTGLDPEGQSTLAGGAGTALYMAPEQVAGSKLGPAADWYAFGTCLYQALTGVLPFAGDSTFAALVRKQQERPRAPSELWPEVPRDLEALCMALLDPSPDTRAGAVEVERVLSAGEAQTSAPALVPSLAPSLGPAAVFDGRQRELEELMQSLLRTHEGELSIVLISGESGVGKSALVGEMLRLAIQRDASTWVLAGRCHEHEQVPYKAFDGCIDALERALGRLRPEVCQALLPPCAGLIAQLFPVLRRVPAIARTSLEGAPAEPMVRRLHAFGLLASLLSRLAEGRPVILSIDDLQWADAESFRLLRALVEHPEPPPVLILATLRPDRELDAELVKQLVNVRSWPCVRTLSLRGLPPSQAHVLAQRLLGEAVPSQRSKEIALESMGNPLLVSELAQFAATREPRSGRAVTLWSALAARVSALAPDARGVLERVALSARPHSELFFEGLFGDRTRFSDVVKSLLSLKLLARRRGGQLVCFHDRIRKAAVSGISTARLPELHAELAAALEADRDCEPSELAYHWDHAGQRACAVAAYSRAGDAALEILAFAQAAQLYGRAIELSSDLADHEGARLLVQRGHALARAGRSAEAAKLYVQAAAQAVGEERVRLRISAAQHQIQSAQVEAGLGNARALLGELGVSLPRGTAASLARIGWERAKLKLRGLGVGETRTDVSARERLELDAMFQLALPALWVDMLPGSALNVIHLGRALSVGERGHVVRALAAEATFRALEAPERTDAYLPLLERCRVLANEADDPALVSLVAFQAGSAAVYRADLTQAAASLSEAHALLMARCPGEPWLLTNVRMGLGSVWGLTGNYAQLAREGPAWFAEAEEREDRFAMAALAGLGSGSTPLLMRGDPDGARALLSRVMEVWPAEPFSLAHHGEMVGTVQAELYRGGAQARAWLLERSAYHDSVFLHRTRLLGASLRMQRAMASLCAAAEATSEHRAQLLDAADEALRFGDTRRAGWIGAAMLSGHGQLAAARGDSERALRDLTTARDRFVSHGMRGLAAGTTYVLGLIEGGDRGRTQREAGLLFFAEQGFSDPWSAIAMQSPVVRLLESGASLAARAPRLLHGRYQPGRDLGRSGFGSVVEALDTRTGRRVMLKSLTQAKPADVSRLKQEFRALSSLHHENLVRLDALFEHEGTCTIAMEHVEGKDFVTHVREGSTLHEGRLRNALTGLLHGAGALHEAGFVHRDLNPENVLVTDEGRVVLLDCGLMTSIDVAERGELDGRAGTLAYVAPEQIDRADFDAAADVYSIGACLYMALTGQLPFDHFTSDRLVDAKRRGRPIPPWAMQIEVPVDLEQLCLDMLSRDPTLRPTVAQALQRLESGVRPGPGGALASLQVHVPPTQVRHVPFTGRERELAALEAAVSEARAGEGRLVLVQGEGGLGKTALVAELLGRVKAREAQALVLRSRCYANEQVAYQAFDAVVDDLARALRRLPREECDVLLPPRAALLAQLFPVLGSVLSIQQASKKGLPAEPATRKREALAAFACLLAKLCERGPVVIAIDDVQWADVESFKLLRALFGERAGPRPLIVATRRRAEARLPAVESELEQLCGWPQTRVLTLGALTESEAARLTVSLLGADIGDERLAALLREGGGHPLFLRELAAYATEGNDLLLEGTLDLDQALGTRLDRLSSEARRLLELLALAASPYAEHVFERAFGDPERYAVALRELWREELVRVRSGGDLVCYHDRVREVAVRLLSPELTVQLSERLASALDRETDSDAGERARLWEHAGKLGQACRAYGEAGDAALEILAFARADALYARALELKGALHDGERLRWLVQRGHALVRLGRSADAARVFLEAAQHADGEQRMRLRVLATQHQLQSAQVDEGLANARAILAELDLPLPRGQAGAVARIMVERGYIAVRGVAVREPQSEIRAKDRLELDALSGLLLPLSWVDMLPGAAVNMRYLRRALAVGEPGHVARALMQEAAFRSMQHPEREQSYQDLLQRSYEIAAAHGDPAVLAAAEFSRATVDFFRSDLASAERHLEAAHELLITRCPGEGWLLTNVRMNLSVIWFMRDHGRLAESSPLWLQEARERQDAFAFAAFSGMGAGYLPLLMRDEPDEARALIEHSMAPWPRLPFALAHNGELMALTVIGAYEGSARALAWQEERMSYHDRAFLHRTRFLGASLQVARAGALCAAYAVATAAERPALLQKLEHVCRRLDSADPTWIGPAALACEAQVALARGDLTRALACAERASTEYTRLQMPMSTHGAEYLAGTLQGGEGGRARCDRALVAYRAHGWRNPRRGLEMGAPMLRLLGA